MAKFEQITSNTIDSYNIKSKNISSETYTGLPIASSSQAGVIKIDDLTITMDENGVIKAVISTENKDYTEHVLNKFIHLSDEERNKVEQAVYHANNIKAHLVSEEKQVIFDKLLLATEHLNLLHLTEDEINSTIEHITNPDIHFDDVDQKDITITKAANSVQTKQSTSNRFLITDENSEVGLSSVSTNLLTYLSSVDKNIDPYLNERFSSIGHTHEEFGKLATSIYDHSTTAEVHFVDDEKQELLDRISTIELNLSSIGRSPRNYSTFYG